MKEEQVIDLTRGARIASGDEVFARKMIRLFSECLPGHKRSLKRAFETRNRGALLRAVHQLHGALCYCGLPRLRRAAAALEKQLRTVPVTHRGRAAAETRLYEQLCSEMTAFEEAYQNWYRRPQRKG